MKPPDTVLSDADRQRIRAEELLRRDLRAELQPPAPVVRSNKLWGFLNSQFGLWMLSSVVLGMLSLLWTSFKDQQNKSDRQHEKAIAEAREDSQFLGQLLPYFTSSTSEVRLRAVEIVRTRYEADSLVPDQVQRLIAGVLFQAGTGDSSIRNRANNNLLASAAEVLDHGASSDPRLAAALQSLPPRVYIHVPATGEPMAGERLRSALIAKGLLVPAIQRISEFPSRNEVRYYFDQDSLAANQVLAAIRGLNNQAVVKKIPWAGVAPKAGTIEAWYFSRSIPPGFDGPLQ